MNADCGSRQHGSAQNPQPQRICEQIRCPSLIATALNSLGRNLHGKSKEPALDFHWQRILELARAPFKASGN
ncbi:hypothetical protein L6164_035066 [Bauhinia variegata]|uniref:Uncharacterized protein n=1 Tax=Bauhinia variegata TaxID=167791 RepID=A0ACB9KWN2_BAUVA|nr:hypothetical protein L6164_035066 [Bauhinia variegata]